MEHNLSAIILKGVYDKTIAEAFDLIGTNLGFGLTMFHIDHYYSACWQAKLNTKGILAINNVEYMLYPSEIVLSELMVKITKTETPLFAIICNEYFDGISIEYANVYEKSNLVDSKINSINKALKYLGVEKKAGKDELDSVGLSKYRSNPKHLEKYHDLADELGV